MSVGHGFAFTAWCSENNFRITMSGSNVIYACIMNAGLILKSGGASPIEQAVVFF